MTDQERKIQRAHLNVELEDAEALVVDLRERLHQYADALDRIREKLRVNASLPPSRDDFDAQIQLRNRLTPEESASIPKVDALAAGIEELRQARQRVSILRERKAQINPRSLSLD